MDNIVEEIIEFSKELYEKNLQENNFEGSEIHGVGEDNNANNKNNVTTK